MKGRPHSAVVSQPAGFVRRVLVLCVVLALSFQAYLAQTHIHGQPLGDAAHASTYTTPVAPANPGYPLDPATCQLCKEMIHAGVAITPAPSVLVFILGWTATADVVALIVPERPCPGPAGKAARLRATETIGFSLILASRPATVSPL